MSRKRVKSTDYGIDKYGYNATDGGNETVWSLSNLYPWANVLADQTTTIKSSDNTDDKAGGDGLLTVEAEGLVAGKITRQTVAMNGTTAVDLADFQIVYRLRPVTTGADRVNAGNITVLHGATGVCYMLAGSGASEMAAMIIPTYNSEGAKINGAWLTAWSAAVSKNSAAIADMNLWINRGGSTGWRSIRRAATVQGGDFPDFGADKWLEPGTWLDLRTDAVTAEMAISGGFNLEYEF